MNYGYARSGAGAKQMAQDLKRITEKNNELHEKISELEHQANLDAKILELTENGSGDSEKDVRIAELEEDLRGSRAEAEKNKQDLLEAHEKISKLEKKGNKNGARSGNKV